MLTPVGWALAAAGGLAALSLGAYKLYRWHKKRKEGTLGVERNRYAETLHAAANDPNHAGHDEARRILRARASAWRKSKEIQGWNSSSAKPRPGSQPASG